MPRFPVRTVPRQKAGHIVVSVAVSGVSVAPFIPLSKLLHFIYPLIGAAGIVIFVGIIIKMFTDGSIPAAQEEK